MMETVTCNICGKDISHEGQYHSSDGIYCQSCFWDGPTGQILKKQYKESERRGKMLLAASLTGLALTIVYAVLSVIKWLWR